MTVWHLLTPLTADPFFAGTDFRSTWMASFSRLENDRRPASRVQIRSAFGRYSIKSSVGEVHVSTTSYPGRISRRSVSSLSRLGRSTDMVPYVLSKLTKAGVEVWRYRENRKIRQTW